MGNQPAPTIRVDPGVRGGWTAIPNWIWSTPDLNASAVRLLGYLLSHTDDFRDRVSMRRAARGANLAWATAQTAAQQLAAAGLVDADQDDAGTWHFALRADAINGPAPTPPAPRGNRADPSRKSRGPLADSARREEQGEQQGEPTPAQRANALLHAWVDWWRASDPTRSTTLPSALPWPALVKIVTQLLAAGWAEREVKYALVDCSPLPGARTTTVSVRTMEIARGERTANQSWSHGTTADRDDLAHRTSYEDPLE